jgi:hypothetical protein
MVSHALLSPIFPVTAACESGPWQASLARCYGLLSVTYSRRVSLPAKGPFPGALINHLISDHVPHTG